MKKGDILRRKAINGKAIGDYVVIESCEKKMHILGKWFIARYIHSKKVFPINANYYVTMKIIYLKVSDKDYQTLSKDLIITYSHDVNKQYLRASHQKDFDLIKFYDRHGNFVFYKGCEIFRRIVAGKEKVKVYLGYKLTYERL